MMMGSGRRQAQLQSLKNRCRNPNMEQNGRLIYYHAQTHDHNEWVGMSYNQQVLADMVAELYKLRREVSDLQQRYLAMMLVRCNVLSQGDCMQFPPGGQMPWWKWLFSVLYPKLQGYNMTPTNFPGGPYYPRTGGESAGNQAAFMKWLESSPMNNSDHYDDHQLPDTENPFFPSMSSDSEGGFW